MIIDKSKLAKSGVLVSGIRYNLDETRCVESIVTSYLYNPIYTIDQVGITNVLNAHKHYLNDKYKLYIENKNSF